MKDAKFNLTKALPNAGANNTTASIDLNVEVPYDNKFRRAFIQVAVPAMSDHTNTSVTDTITLQDSADNSNFANTTPLIQIATVGVANGPAAQTVKVPLPPSVRRYVRFLQDVPANGGTGNNATVTYDLVT